MMFVSFSIAYLTKIELVIILFGTLLLLNIAYSLPPFILSWRGSIAPALLPMGYITLTVISGFSASGAEIDKTTLWFLSGMYLHFLSRILLKDHRDMIGDKKAGKKTLILKKGNKFVSYLSFVFFLTSSIILLAVLWDFIHFWISNLVLVIGAALTMLVFLSKAEFWPEQRLFITVFGRLCSALVCLFIISFLINIFPINRTLATVYMVLLLAGFLVSINKIIQLQKYTN